MSGFEFTPAGIMPLGAWRGAQSEGDIAGATADVPTVIAAPVVRTSPTPAPVPAYKARIDLRPQDVIKLARARLRDVEREIKRLHKLETERDELKRLLAAAGNKPRAVIRSMPTRSA